MNANSSLTIANWLAEANGQLKSANIPSSQLDSLILLEHVTGLDRAYILAHPEKPISSADQKELTQLVDQRVQRIPIAYLINKVEFYGREFEVNSHVLIPRPESEALIETLLQLDLPSQAQLVDVGTGSGILGLTAGLELPNLTVTLVDISKPALAVARSNAERHHLRVSVLEANLLDFDHSPFNVILANLPYVDRAWPRSAETDHEPSIALFADDSGLALIKQLITQSVTHLTDDGYLILEADPRQFRSIVTYAQSYHLNEHSRDGYCLALRRLN